jgi:acyl-homoserine lactone acylase PvdQ
MTPNATTTPKPAPATKPAPTPAPAENRESKADRFKRVAGARTTALLKAFDHLENTANKGTYEWTDDQASKVIAALRERVDRLERRYGGETVKDDGFKL